MAGDNTSTSVTRNVLWLVKMWMHYSAAMTGVCSSQSFSRQRATRTVTMGNSRH